MFIQCEVLWFVITRWCGSSSCVRCLKAGKDYPVYENSWAIMSPPVLLCSFKATWREGLWECEFLNLYTLYNEQQHGVCTMWMVLDCICCISQSLLMVVVGFTFTDEQVPTDFLPHWDDWLGETTESVQDWRTGPFHQHLPPRKVLFKNCSFFFLLSLHTLK